MATFSEIIDQIVNNNISEVHLESVDLTQITGLVDGHPATGLELLKWALERNSSVEELHLCACNLTAENAASISSIVAFHPRLMHLSLDDNNLGDQFFAEFAAGLTSSRKLKSLSFRSTNLTATGLRSLKVGMSTNRILELDVSNNNLNNSGAEILAGIISLSSLTCILASNCQIYPAGMISLSEALVKSSRCVNIDLGYNPFGDAGLRSLLKDNNKLLWQNLNLQSCGITSEGASLIAEAFKSSRFEHLILLDLSGNLIDASGLHNSNNDGLCDVLTNNEILEQLKLRANPLGNEGILGVVNSLQQKTSHIILDIRSTGVTEACIAELEQALGKLSLPFSIYISENDLAPTTLDNLSTRFPRVTFNDKEDGNGEMRTFFSMGDIGDELDRIRADSNPDPDVTLGNPPPFKPVGIGFAFTGSRYSP
jgi:Ran GTPase-activating protein (RanGAP) involved in mRNA processing and transport